MLTSVPKAITAASRRVTLAHPNSFSCIVSRRVVKRVELDGQGQPSEMGASPTLGGLGVLRSEDEAEIEYVELGPAKLKFSGQLPGQDIIERDNGTLPAQQSEVTMYCLADEGEPGYFVPDTNDLVAVDMGLGVVMAFEIEKPVSSVMIAPYTRRYLLNLRDDLSYAAGFDN